MNFNNSKRPLCSMVANSETISTLEKKQCKKASTAAEMDESDVSLSDDDDDEMVKLSRSRQTPCSHRDGSVAVPGQSTVFLKIVEQHERQHQIAKTSLAESGRLPDSRSRPAIDGIHTSLPVRAVSSISRIHQNQASNAQALPATKAITSKNSILNATSSLPISAKSTSNPILGINIKEHKDLRMVGSVLLSSTNLNRNSSQSASRPGPKQSILRTGNAVLDKIHFGGSGTGGSANKKVCLEKENFLLQEKAMAKKNAELLEIQQLLGTKSSHAEEREGEWFDGFDKRTAKLAEKEENRKKMSSVVSAFVRAYHCKDCKIVTESALAMQLCSNKNHSVTQVRGVKWFFECTVCQRRDSTLSVAPSSSSAGRSTGRGDPNDNKRKSSELPDTEIVSGCSSKQHPTRRCECGGFSWRSSSKYGSNEGTSIKTDQKIILSASEWTSKKDLASLDSIRSSVL